MKTLAQHMKEIADNANAAKEQKETAEGLQYFLNIVETFAEAGNYYLFISESLMEDAKPYRLSPNQEERIIVGKRTNLKSLSALIEGYGFSTSFDDRGYLKVFWGE